MLRFLTAGESHGPFEIGILEGIPANLTIDSNFIQGELDKRKGNKGRSGRGQIENDQVEILSGVRFGKTIGSPIALLIKNLDYDSWKNKQEKDIKVTNPRPGHADLSGAIKFGFKDARPILERSSARETVMRVAVGAVCKIFLKEFNIEITSKIIRIGNSNKDDLIKEAIKKKDTLGGVVEVEVNNVPTGLGSHIQWDKRLDGMLAQAVMSVPSVKAVEIGEGIDNSLKFGSQVHDEILYEKGRYKRKTNRAGGIEGGITNGEEIVLRAYLKPLPTLGKPLNTIDIETKKNVKALYERSDVCAIPRVGVILENMVAIVLVKTFLEKFGGDSMSETKGNFDSYIRNL